MKANEVSQNIFVSQTRQKLISIFFYQPDELFYVRQLVRLVDEEINLSKSGLIISDARGNRLYYSVNKDNPLYLSMLVLAHQIKGLGLDLQSTKVGLVKLVLFSNSFLSASVNESPSNEIDMLIIGDANIREVDTYVKKEESLIGREINYMVMDKNEFKIRKQKRDPVIIDFFIKCPSVIIGNPQTFDRF
jgi:hypothetical protein